MKKNKYIEKVKEELEKLNIPYFEGAEVLQEIGRPYLYRLDLYTYKNDLKIRIRQNTDYLYAETENGTEIPTEIKELIDNVLKSIQESKKEYIYKGENIIISADFSEDGYIALSGTRNGNVYVLDEIFNPGKLVTTMMQELTKSQQAINNFEFHFVNAHKLLENKADEDGRYDMDDLCIGIEKIQEENEKSKELVTTLRGLLKKHNIVDITNADNLNIDY